MFVIIQYGDSVYTVDSSGKFVKLPLTYVEYPEQPSPDALNQSIDWLLDFFKRHALPFTVLIDEESSKGPGAVTTIVYANIKSGSSVKHTLALYTVANAITTGSTQSLDTTLLEELT